VPFLRSDGVVAPAAAAAASARWFVGRRVVAPAPVVIVLRAAASTWLLLRASSALSSTEQRRSVDADSEHAERELSSVRENVCKQLKETLTQHIQKQQIHRPLSHSGL